MHMKVVFLSLIVLLASTATWAQDCDPYVSVTDATCSEAGNLCQGTALHGCQSTTFQAPCDQNYTLICEVQCTGGADCKGCEGEAYLYKQTTRVSCVHTGCGAGADCYEETTVPLERGVTYTLYACKLKCNAQGYGSCNSCSADCTVSAKVRP